MGGLFKRVGLPIGRLVNNNIKLEGLDKYLGSPDLHVCVPTLGFFFNIFPPLFFEWDGGGNFGRPPPKFLCIPTPSFNKSV